MPFYLEMRDEDGNVSRVELKPGEALDRLDSVPASHIATVLSPTGDRWTADEARRRLASVNLDAD